MKKRIRIIALILAHLGVILSILYLAFFVTVRIRADRVPDARDETSETDLYLRQALDERDFSIFSVGKALSEESGTAKENLFMALDLVIPALCLTSGILLQIAVTRTRKKHKPLEPAPVQPTNNRRSL